jgi:hypothetical protein
MTKRAQERQRLYSIVAYCDEITPAQARIMYLSQHGDISMQRVRQILVEMADDGTIEHPRKGVYTARSKT